MSKELEKPDLDKQVEAYARTHRREHLVAHFGPLGAGGALSLLSLGVAPALLPIILCVSILYFMMSAYQYNQKAVAWAKSPERELEEKRAEAAAAEAKVKSFIESEDAVRAKPLSEYDCPNYEQVTWDMKLVNEKIIPIADVSVCDVQGCFLCTPIKEEQVKEAKALRDAEIKRKEIEWKRELEEIRKRQEKRATESDNRMLAGMSDANAERVNAWHGSLFNNPDFSKTKVDDLLDSAIIFKKDLKPEAKVIQCPEHEENKMVETWFYGLCPEHRLAQLLEADRLAEIRRKAETKAAREAAKAEKERQFQERRKVDVNGIHTLRPMEVPEGAVPSLLHGRELDPLATHSYIVWKWTENGKDTLFFKQPIAIDAYSVTGDRGVIKTWFSAHDPETGEYLGDYSTEAKNAKMEYHTKLMQDVKVFNK